jgi:Na+-driven multidrug efflux pump
MGITALATHQIFLRIQSVLTMAFTGFGLASMTLVGKKIGADEQQQAISTGNMTAGVALIFAILVASVMIIFPQQLLSLFTSDQNVIVFGVSALIALAIIQIPKAINIVFTGNLRGSADLAWLMWLAISSVILFETVGAYILAVMFNTMLVGIWLIQGVDESFRFGLNYWRFRKQKWIGKKIL